MKYLIRSVFASLFLLCLPVLGIEPAESLLVKLTQQNTIEADFVQSVYNESGKLITESHGKLKLSRPRRCYWRVESPDNQWIVANGQWVWIYDMDLNQVVKRQQDDQSSLPIQVLTGSEQALTDYFDVSMLPSQSEHELNYNLHAKQDNSSFSDIVIGFKSDKLSSMRVKDQLAQETLFKFDQVKVNEPIADHWFNFVPPNGVDVILE